MTNGGVQAESHVCASGTDEPMIVCAGVTRTFGSGPTSVVAVYDVTCAVPVGSRIALTGSSGSGKSTLLHLMAGLDRPTSGRLTRPALDWTAGVGGIGVVFQGASLLPALDVVENVSLPLLFADVEPDAATDRAHDALRRLGIAELAGRLPSQLSGGQAQRVALARVLAGAPALVLADEPTGQLDHRAAAHVVDVLLEVCGELGATLVLTTHDRHVAARLDEEWAMRDGHLDNGATEART